MSDLKSISQIVHDQRALAYLESIIATSNELRAFLALVPFKESDLAELARIDNILDQILKYHQGL
jgi:hypothetical protein